MYGHTHTSGDRAMRASYSARMRELMAAAGVDPSGVRDIVDLGWCVRHGGGVVVMLVI